MESQKAKVAMYVKRSFGDKMNASFYKGELETFVQVCHVSDIALVSDSGIEPEWADEWLYGYYDGG